MSTQAKHGRLYRSRNACLGGVCAGIAERYEFDTLVIRILAMLLCLATVGIGAVVYAVMWAVLPLEPESAVPYEVAPQQAESTAYGLFDASPADLCAQAGVGSDRLSILARLAVAVCLTMLFMVVACGVSPMVSGSHWWQFWPLGLLIVGLFLVVVPVRGAHEIVWHAVGIIIMSMSAAMLPMSLEAISWASFPYALGKMWPLVIAAGALFVVGVLKHVNALIIVGSLLVAVFCLALLVTCALPGPSGALVLHVLDGRSVRLFVAAWTSALV